MSKVRKNRNTVHNSTYPKVAVQWLNLSAFAFRQAGQALCPPQADLCLADSEMLRKSPPSDSCKPLWATSEKANMKSVLFLSFLFFGMFPANGQETKEYLVETEAGNSIRNFRVELPASWYLTNATQGTPYVLIGILPSEQETYQLTECSPELRIGFRVYQKPLDEALAVLGLQKTSDNIYMFQDNDNYVSIILLFGFEGAHTKGLTFTINKLTTCLTNPEEKKKKTKKRTTKPNQYIVFSYQNTTIFIESLNGEFDSKVIDLINSTFKINT